ncbi:MAG: hypothetical protein GX876_00025 [Bacteroidales bacterium]|nr:hypothetical protein [Bacteroidales bacterium]
MANIIIGIHGLGNKPPEDLLRKWWKDAMYEGLKNSGHNSGLIRFRLAYWADILYDKRQDPDEKDPASPYFMDEKYNEAAGDFSEEDYRTRKKVVDFLSRQMNRIFLNKDLTLNYSSITDTLMRRYFNDLKIYYSGDILDIESNESLRAGELIRERLHSLLKAHRKDEIMLIGHSMGSIIAYDVLTFLAPDIRINTFVTIGSPLGLPVIVSRIAAENRQRNININRLTTPPGVIRKWYNFSDLHDKVAFNYKLSDYYFKNVHGVKPADMLIINNYECNGVRNPHKSFGYLRTPEFSEILNEFILSEKLSFIQKTSRRFSRMTRSLKSLISPAKTENKP